MKNIFRVIFVVGLVFFTFQPSLAMGKFFFLENEEIGKSAPDFTLSTLAGKEMSLEQFRGEDKAIVFFWATWCPHCRRALGNLNQKKEEFAKKGIKIALVNIGEEASVVKKYFEKNQINMMVFLDEDSSVAQSYNIVGLPTFWLVDGKGIIRDVEYGLPENYEEILSTP